MRRTDIQRDSKPASHQLFSSPEEKARLEAQNGLLQFDEVIRLIDKSQKEKFRLRPSTIQNLQRVAIKDIYTCAGNYRTGPVIICGTTHQPPMPSDVAGLVEEMCDYVTENWDKSPIYLAAYCMWRVNWIHPFSGGNGRTSRAVSYLVLCAKLGYQLPGILTIPEQIVANRQPYYEALDAADAAWANGEIDVSKMEQLLSDMLAKQLLSTYKAATGAP